MQATFLEPPPNLQLGQASATTATSQGLCNKIRLQGGGAKPRVQRDIEDPDGC